MVNSIIQKGFVVTREELPIKEALAKGALAFFREKYPDVVSVYSVIQPKTQEVYSMEFCGGPHVQDSSSLGNFSIQSEKSVAKGIRRIKAVLEKRT
jgi:alanyl-tRNA synthetase